MGRHSTFPVVAKRVLRWVAGLAVAGVFLAGSIVMASMHGWSVTPNGLHRLAEAPQTLLSSIALGVLASWQHG